MVGFLFCSNGNFVTDTHNDDVGDEHCIYYLYLNEHIRQFFCWFTLLWYLLCFNWFSLLFSSMHTHLHCHHFEMFVKIYLQNMLFYFFALFAFHWLYRCASLNVVFFLIYFWLVIASSFFNLLFGVGLWNCVCVCVCISFNWLLYDLIYFLVILQNSIQKKTICVHAPAVNFMEKEAISQCFFLNALALHTHMLSTTI